VEISTQIAVSRKDARKRALAPLRETINSRKSADEPALLTVGASLLNKAFEKQFIQ
jgi:hypothetical protein